MAVQVLKPKCSDGPGGRLLESVGCWRASARLRAEFFSKQGSWDCYAHHMPRNSDCSFLKCSGYSLVIGVARETSVANDHALILP